MNNGVLITAIDQIDDVRPFFKAVAFKPVISEIRI